MINQERWPIAIVPVFVPINMIGRREEGNVVDCVYTGSARHDDQHFSKTSALGVRR